MKLSRENVANKVYPWLQNV